MSITFPRKALTGAGCALVACLLASCGEESSAPATSTPSTPAPAPESAPAVRAVNFDGVEPASGWMASITGADGERASIIAAAPAFVLGAGESLHPGVAPDGLSVEYAATLQTTAPGRYRLAAEVEGGEATIRCYDLNGNELGASAPARTPRLIQTDWLQLTDEPHTVLVSFDRTNADARLRLTWEKQGVGSDGFVAEAIPTELVSVPAENRRDAARATLAMEGRVLLGELGCVNCHEAEGGVYARTAPLLGEIGRRAGPQWIREWIADPQLLKPGTGMPDVFGAAGGQFNQGEDQEDIDTITHFLVSLGGPQDYYWSLADEDIVIDQGRRLYHSVGCVSCHGAFESPLAVYDEPGLSSSIPEHDPPHPFGILELKWSPAALSEFLQDPTRTHPGGRMPSMNLTASEADLIATYLTTQLTIPRRQVVPEPYEYDPEQVETGRYAFIARGCANCHEIGHNQAPVESSFMSIALAGVVPTKGPMDPTDEVHIRYDLTERQRDALRVALEDLQSGASHHAPIDEAHLRIGALGCLHCHDKDDRGGLAEGVKPYLRTRDEAELGDEGRFPPHLSGVGFKLTTPWLREILTSAGTARPYMTARMPQFGEGAVADLADHLAMMDGVRPNSDETEPEVTDEMIMAGRSLSGEGGLNCISCHVFGDLPPAGTPGPDITAFAERLRYAWWRDYVLNPPRFKPGTRMPLFYYAGRGAVTDVYGGDPHRQADALWAYFTLGQFMPPPEGLAEDGGLALRVSDKPVVFRTYLEDAGSRAIAVGYPVGLHFAFDAEAIRFVDAWKGEFIDATGAWKNRGGNNTGGQGPVVWTAPAGPALQIGKKPMEWPDDWSNVRFRGYRFDEAHVPSFRYEIGREAVVSVQESAIPLDVATGAFERRFVISGHAASSIWVNVGPSAAGFVAAGADVHQEGDLLAVIPQGDGPVMLNVEVRP